MTLQGQRLWEPPADAWHTSRMGRFASRLNGARDLVEQDYDALWRWSVRDLEGFWAEVAREFDVRFHDRPEQILTSRAMPGAEWFPGATLSYPEHALRRRDDAPAVIARSQTRDDVVVSFAELAAQVGAATAGLARLGVGPGDRVVAYLPNIPETLVAFLACASLGAVWSSCAPEFGVRSVVDRVEQIAPKVLLVVDGYRYGAKAVDRTQEVAEIRAALPSLEATVVLPYLDVAGTGTIDTRRFPGAIAWDELVADPAEPRFTAVGFDHPLYVLYSSGTTGLPKPIVHGHGGILLEHAKVLGLHQDLGRDDRFTWFTTTGWMMWNYLVSGLVVESTLVLFDGDPGWPDLDTLWSLAAETEVSVFGTSAPFLLASRRAGLEPGRAHDLSALREVGSTGAPLPPEGFGWVYEHVKRDVLLASVSGGTDVCTAFVAGAPVLPVHAGEIACRCLGAAVESVDSAGRPVRGTRGELVITEPMPSMPVGFWNDPDGRRYRSAYFEDHPGVWTHGDFIEITDRGSCIITGRSDATLNRGGVRMGTSEFYSVVEAVEGVTDSLVVHLEDADGGPGELLLFVTLAPGVDLDDEVRRRLAGAIRAQLSPRHVPDTVQAIPAVPRTISGKKLEVPIKRLLLGEAPDQVVNPGALADPGALEVFVSLAASRV